MKVYPCLVVTVGEGLAWKLTERVPHERSLHSLHVESLHDVERLKVLLQTASPQWRVTCGQLVNEQPALTYVAEVDDSLLTEEDWQEHVVSEVEVVAPRNQSMPSGLTARFAGDHVLRVTHGHDSLPEEVEMTVEPWQLDATWQRLVRDLQGNAAEGDTLLFYYM